MRIEQWFEDAIRLAEYDLRTAPRWSWAGQRKRWRLRKQLRRLRRELKAEQEGF